MSSTLTDLINEVKSHNQELRARVDESDAEQKRRHEDLTSKNATISAEMKQTVDAINAKINELDDQIEKIHLAEKQAALAANRPPLVYGQQKRSAAHQAFIKGLKSRDLQVGATLTPEEKALVVPAYMPTEQKALYGADATTGGYWAASDFLNELLAYRLNVSKMRTICRIQPTSGEKITMPSLANDVTVYWTSEQAQYKDSQDATTSMIEIPVHEIRALLKVSQQNLEDSMFNLEDFLKDRMMKAFAKKEGAAFINGSGNGQPQGLMKFPMKATTSYAGGSAGKNNVTDAVPFVLSGAAAGKINADDVLNVKMDLKSDYDPGSTYVFTRGTLNSIRLLKDSQNRPLWQPFGGSDLPSTIYDTPYVEMPDMAEIGSGAFPIACGDFSNYMIVDRVQLAIRELDELFAVSGLIGFIARMRVGGQVLLPEAFRTLKVN